MGMKILAVVFIIAFIGFTDGRKRTKRNLIQLAEEIRDVTGRNPLKFNGYGCYCGWGGSGTPVDANDECCKRHDDCYGSITNDMPGCDPKFNSYDWDITGKTIDCLDQTPKNSVKKILFQPKSAKNCPRRICECDKNLVECLYKNPYNAENYDLDKNLKCKSTTGNTGM